MKNTMKLQVRLLFLALLGAFVMVACNRNNNVAPEKEDGFQLQTNSEEYTKLVNARTEYKGTPFEIKSVTRDGDILKISVEGGCLESDYKIVWDGILMESYPEQARLVVYHEQTQNVQCLVIGKFTLEVDMKKLFGRTGVIVHVANGSQVKDVTINPDGSVTDKP